MQGTADEDAYIAGGPLLYGSTYVFRTLALDLDMQSPDCHIAHISEPTAINLTQTVERMAHKL